MVEECGGAYKVSGEFTDVNGNVDRVEFRLVDSNGFFLGPLDIEIVQYTE